VIIKYLSFKKLEIPDVNSFLFYGENSGRIEDCVDMTVKFIKQKYENINIINVSNEDLKTNSFQSLISNYNNLDLFGNKNIVIFSIIDQKTSKEITKYLANQSLTFYLICKSDQLKKASAFRRFFENSDHSVTVACYEETEQEKNSLIKSSLLDDEIKVSENELSQLSNILSNQRHEILNELQKVKISIKTSKKTLAESIDLICRKSNGDIDNLVYSLASKEKNNFLVNFFNSKEIQNDLIRFVNYFSEHLFKLLEVKEKIRNGENRNLAVKSLKPPIFFKRLDKFNNQVEQWHEKEILQILKKLFLFRVASLKGKNSSKFQLYFLFLKILN
jgi:DNA polymerase-3 subunit delta